MAELLVCSLLLILAIFGGAYVLVAGFIILFFPHTHPWSAAIRRRHKLK